MKIAVCARDMDERHHISRLLDEALPIRGLVPKISLFPIPDELLESVAKKERVFDVVLLSGQKEDSHIQQLCRLTPVMLIGKQDLSPVAFDVGAVYFIESPVDKSKIDRAFSHYLQTRNDSATAPRLASRIRLQYEK